MEQIIDDFFEECACDLCTEKRAAVQEGIERGIGREKHMRDVAEEALKIISGNRKATYGDARSSFQQIAEFWEAYLKRRAAGPLTGRDVANMMKLMKISRNAVNHKRDNNVDIIGYALLEEGWLVDDVY